MRLGKPASFGLRMAVRCCGPNRVLTAYRPDCFGAGNSLYREGAAWCCLERLDLLYYKSCSQVRTNSRDADMQVPGRGTPAEDRSGTWSQNARWLAICLEHPNRRNRPGPEQDLRRQSKPTICSLPRYHLPVRVTPRAPNRRKVIKKRSNLVKTCPKTVEIMPDPVWWKGGCRQPKSIGQPIRCVNVHCRFPPKRVIWCHLDRPHGDALLCLSGLE
jgi:hypothetical protein